jgi:hypothetical protein
MDNAPPAEYSCIVTAIAILTSDKKNLGFKVGN